MHSPAKHDKPGAADEPPPLLGSWPRLYAVVLAFLLALIVLFRMLQWVLTP